LIVFDFHALAVVQP